MPVTQTDFLLTIGQLSRTQRDLLHKIAEKLIKDKKQSFESRLTRLLSASIPLPYPTWREMEVASVDVQEDGSGINRPLQYFTADQETFRIDPEMAAVMSNPAYRTLSGYKNLTLVRARVGDLGFDERPSRKEVWQRVRSIGGKPCPPEPRP